MGNYEVNIYEGRGLRSNNAEGFIHSVATSTHVGFFRMLTVVQPYAEKLRHRGQGAENLGIIIS